MCGVDGKHSLMSWAAFYGAVIFLLDCIASILVMDVKGLTVIRIMLVTTATILHTSNNNVQNIAVRLH